MLLGKKWHFPNRCVAETEEMVLGGAVCPNQNIQKHKYTNTQTNKYTKTYTQTYIQINTQIHKYTNKQTLSQQMCGRNGRDGS